MFGVKYFRLDFFRLFFLFKSKVFQGVIQHQIVQVISCVATINPMVSVWVDEHVKLLVRFN